MTKLTGYVYATVATTPRGQTGMQIYSTTDSEFMPPLHQQLTLLGANVARRTLASIQANPGESREAFTRRLKALESLYM